MSIKNEWADNSAPHATVWHESIEKNRWQTQTQEGNRAVNLSALRWQRLLNRAEKNVHSWKEDSSKDSDSYTFDKNLREALLLPNHALVHCVIRKVALVDSELPLEAHALKHIPGHTGRTEEERERERERERQREREREREREFE